MKGRTASVTCFMGMNLMMLLSVFFTLLEMLHFYSLRRFEPLVSQISIESAFADYNRILWNEYGILGIDSSYGTGTADMQRVSDRMLAYLQDNAGITTSKDATHGVSFLKMAAGEVRIGEYGLLTDNHGVPFMQLAAKEEWYETTGDIVGVLTRKADEVTRSENEQPDMNEVLAEADDALSEAADIAEEMGEDGEWIYTMPDDEIAAIGNPIETVGAASGASWLAAAIPAGRTLSEAAFAAGARVSERSLAAGAAPVPSSISPADRVMYLKFLIDHYSDFAHPKNHGGIQYELEYMVGGKTTDEANLKAVVERLMIAREAANFAHIMGDTEKYDLTYAVALALVGFTANEAIIRATQMGIIVAWSMGESILDIRALLSGKRIATMKNAEEWTLDLSMLGAAMSGKLEADECTRGFTYEEYLYGLMFVMSERTLGLRGLDVLEDVLHHTADYANVKMDQMIYCMDVSFSYEAAPLFLSFVVLLNDKPGAYHFGRKLSMTYLE